jgi:glycyl-tRNA synthetase beta chain
MSENMILEIGTEELPAGFIPPALAQLKDMMVKELNSARLEFQHVITMGTPRRLAVFVENMSDRQSDVIKEVKGPPRKASYDGDGNPTSAAKGFAKSQKLDLKDLFVKTHGQGEYLFARVLEEGKSSIDVMSELFPLIIKKIYFPKNMYWEESLFRFTRPVRWILALSGSSVIPFKIAGLSSGRITYGHRFLSSGPIEVPCADQFKELLYNNMVILDHNQRKDMIEKEIVSLTESSGGTILNNPSLMEEVNFLVEYPACFMGSYSPDYLELPKEVLVTVMSKHQRYFAVTGNKGDIMPYFIAVRNGDRRGLDLVKLGNERVLDARFSDAKFFFHEDRKVSLDTYLPRLQSIGFQKNLGNMFDKSGRIKELTRFILTTMGKKELIKDGERSAEICKADLASHMVKEFPELQGIMGSIYASNESEEVQKAIRNHYKPAFSQDSLPGTLTGQVISFADKLDSVAGCLGMGFVPTGSADPYGLRRYILGIIRLLAHGYVEGCLLEFFYRAFDLYLQGGFALKDKKKVSDDFEDFTFQRLENYLLSAGLRYDVIKSVRHGALRNIKDTISRVKAITAIRDFPEFLSLVIAFTRAFNILKKSPADRAEFALNLLQEEEEKVLYSHFKETSDEIQKLFLVPDMVDYPEVMSKLSSLRPSIDKFFDKVMVMVPDETLRNNRLSLLDMVVNLYLKVADFSEIVVEGSNIV